MKITKMMMEMEKQIILDSRIGLPVLDIMIERERGWGGGMKPMTVGNGMNETRSS